MKKAEVDPMKAIAGIILVIATLILLLFLYRSLLGEGHDAIKDPIDRIDNDCDGDNIKDMVDPCVCTDKNICKAGDLSAIAECRKRTEENC